MKYAHILSYVASTPWAILPSKLSELLAILAFRASGGTFTPAEIEARIGAREPGAAHLQGNGVAIVPIRGVIAHRMGTMDDSSGGTSAERIGAMLRQVAADESVGTVVLDVDSPGGTVAGIQELAAQLFEMRGRGTQRIVAHVNSLAASAAYWIASQADEIVSTPSGEAGSIGVVFAHKDLSEALKAEGINVTLLSAGKYKTEAMPFGPLSDEGKAFLQARVNDAYGQFVKDVARGRGVAVGDVRNGYGEGRVLSAKDAKAAGLIDRIATLDEVISKAAGRRATAGARAEADAPALAAEAPPVAVAEVVAASNGDLRRWSGF